MFDSDVSRDMQSRKITRRMFLASGATVGLGFAVLSRYSSTVEASGAVHGTPGEVTIVNFSDNGTNLGSETVAKVVKTDGAWRQKLGANSFGIARQADTEMPYSGVSWKEHGRGIFRCICCDTALFNSQTKFESGTGWPSFWAPIAQENVLQRLMLRWAWSELRSDACDARDTLGTSSMMGRSLPGCATA